MASTDDSRVTYARRLYDDILGWYHSADNKAQVVLGLDGIFLTLIAGTLFAEPAKLKAIAESIPPLVWLLLAVMTLCLLASVVSAVYCLWSRMHSTSDVSQDIETSERGHTDVSTYAPRILWFFQYVALLDMGRVERTLRTVDESFEIEAMTSQIHILARHVRKKHLAVDIGFLLTAATLFLFFFAGVIYGLHSLP